MSPRVNAVPLTRKPGSRSVRTGEDFVVRLRPGVDRLRGDRGGASVDEIRGTRFSVGSGIPGNDAVYYMGTPGGGVWKTEDGGVVWRPIFDSEHVASIGAVV